MPSGSRLLPSFHKTCFARTIKTGVILKFRLLGGGVQIIILNAKILKNEGQKTLIFGQLSVKTILRKTNDYSTSLKIFVCVTKKYLNTYQLTATLDSLRSSLMASASRMKTSGQWQERKARSSSSSCHWLKLVRDRRLLASSSSSGHRGNISCQCF